MAHRICFSYWLSIFWLVVTVAEGQEEAVTLPRSLQDNVDPTDCQIFTLTPPPVTRSPVTRIQPITRSPVTRIQPITRTPKCPFHFFPPRRPRVHIRFPNRAFLPPKCNHRFQFRPYFWPHGRLTPHYNYFTRRRLWTGSSSEESRKKREAPNMPMFQKRL
ncbi:odontogenesis associated phosphoprotein [Rousettus aegyptiacus]|uniref:Odontogenesis associated phosphoprotein n=1 Tax=Rousettus aegyptiacus TaxID=9407 RepID=A0A7J8E9Z2_ROUAE|nr:odontogenesis associated phosphoprotein [Rousettus aegyptiacus]KAF6432009.1 odontogenesis associated phosphoprotein [Rousettus aegyptiacus]